MSGIKTRLEKGNLDGEEQRSSLLLLVGVGIVAGVVIAAVDNLAFDGEVSPKVIAAMLFVTTASFGGIWSWRGGLAAVVA